VLFVSVRMSVCVSMHVRQSLYSRPSFVFANASRSSNARCLSGNRPAARQWRAAQRDATHTGEQARELMQVPHNLVLVRVDDAAVVRDARVDEALKDRRASVGTRGSVSRVHRERYARTAA
jgi:hypothetical protein